MSSAFAVEHSVDTATPDARGDVVLALVDDERLLDGRAQQLGELGGLVDVGDAVHHGELVAAQPGDGRPVGRALADPRRRGAEQGVTVVVAHRVVDHLEPVEVDEQHGDPAVADESGAEVADERGSVREPGEGVDVGGSFAGVAERELRRHVGHDDEAGRAPVEHRVGAGDLDVDQLTVGATVSPRPGRRVRLDAGVADRGRQHAPVGVRPDVEDVATHEVGAIPAVAVDREVVDGDDLQRRRVVQPSCPVDGPGDGLERLAAGDPSRQPFDGGRRWWQLDRASRMEVDQLLDLASQEAERVELCLVEPAGVVVEHAQRPDRFAVGAHRHAGVGADAGTARHQRVACEAVVERGVGDHQFVVAGDDVVAERDVAARLGDRQPDRGLEPLAVLVDERHRDHRHPERAGGERDHGVEGRVGGRVEDRQAVQRGEAPAFARCAQHRRRQRRRPRPHPSHPPVRTSGAMVDDRDVAQQSRSQRATWVRARARVDACASCERV